jgi:membrane protease YdiL (CAAX protease family)
VTFLIAVVARRSVAREVVADPMAVAISLQIALGLLVVVIQLDGSECLLHASSMRRGQSTNVWIVPPLSNGLAKKVSFTQLSVSFTPNQLKVTRPFENVDSAAASRASSFGSNASKHVQGADAPSNEGAKFLIDSGKGSINLPLLRSVCSSQFFMLLVAVSLFAAFGGDHHVLPSLALPSASPALTFLATSVLASSILSLSLCFYEWTSHSSYRPASQIDFATSHLVYDLFGRRSLHNHQSASNVQHSTSAGDMFATVLVIGLVSFITAVCQELSFRGFFYETISSPSAIGQMPAAIAGAVIGQAALYAALTTPCIDARSTKLDFLSFTFKFMAGLLLGLLAETSHSLLPCVAVQFLSTWHVMSKSWVHVNRHMDWVEQQRTPAVSYDHTTARISSDIRRSLFRFFCAFDSDENQTLSLSDVQRAVSFAFWHSEDPPSQEEVRQSVLSRVQEVSLCGDHQQRPGDSRWESVRIDFDSFVNVMVALRKRSP